METLFIFAIGALISYIILYFVIKTAVRNAIIEARENHNDNKEDGTHIAQVSCKHCSKNYDMDYPKCPYCG